MDSLNIINKTKYINVRVHTDIQIFFQDLLPGLKNPFFQDFPENVQIETLVARDQKVHIQNRLSVYLH